MNTMSKCASRPKTIGYILGRALAWLWVCMPVTRLRMFRAVEAARLAALKREQEAQKQHSKRVADAYITADRIVRHCTEIVVERPGYRNVSITLHFAPHLVDNFVANAVLERMSRVIGAHVESFIRRGNWKTQHATWCVNELHPMPRCNCNKCLGITEQAP